MAMKKQAKIVTRTTVEHVARLARLNLEDEEIKRFEKDLNEILNAFKDLDKAPLKNVEPSFHPLPVRDVMREDEEEKCYSQDQALSNTKHKERGFFKGPKAV